MRNKIVLGVAALAAVAAGVWFSLRPDKDRLRAEKLAATPVLYTSEVLCASPEAPDDDIITPMDDSYDPNLYQAMADDYHTPNYVPGAVLALSERQAALDKGRRPASIRIGDHVEVLAKADNGSGKAVYLVRTVGKTYCWLYAFHLQDAAGERLESLQRLD